MILSAFYKNSVGSDNVELGIFLDQSPQPDTRFVPNIFGSALLPKRFAQEAKQAYTYVDTAIGGDTIKGVGQIGQDGVALLHLEYGPVRTDIDIDDAFGQALANKLRIPSL